MFAALGEGARWLAMGGGALLTAVSLGGLWFNARPTAEPAVAQVSPAAQERLDATNYGSVDVAEPDLSAFPTFDPDLPPDVYQELPSDWGGPLTVGDNGSMSLDSAGEGDYLTVGVVLAGDEDVSALEGEPVQIRGEYDGDDVHGAVLLEPRPANVTGLVDASGQALRLHDGRGYRTLPVSGVELPPPGTLVTLEGFLYENDRFVASGEPQLVAAPSQTQGLTDAITAD